MAIQFGSPEALRVLETDKLRFALEREGDPERLVECPTCKGKGYQDATCPHCGNEYQEDCEDCDGSGEVTAAQADEIIWNREKRLQKAA